jgi:phosphatidylglycerophosphate synthase
MSTPRQYSYDLSVKSDVSDELINVYVSRPVAGVLVRALYHTSITPNQVTVAATLSGFTAAAFYFAADPTATVCAGAFVMLKDLLDSADGQLARAKQMYSRAGRFLDSIGDFLVNLSLFAAIGSVLAISSGNVLYLAFAAIGFLCVTLRVSYHVYYQTSFLHLRQLYPTNRITEEIREEDLLKDRQTLLLQHFFQLLYGWQDRFIVKIDTWCRGYSPYVVQDPEWYADRTGLRLSGFLGLGTELFLLTACSVMNQLTWYLYCNLGLMNGLWLASIWYRRRVLALRRSTSFDRSREEDVTQSQDTLQR